MTINELKEWEEVGTPLMNFKQLLALLGQGYIRFLMFKKFPIMRFFYLIEINLF